MREGNRVGRGKKGLPVFPGLKSEWRLVWARMLVFLALFLLLAAVRAKADATVLIYHRFGEDNIPTTNVPLENFKEQMAYLRDNGYHVVPLQTIVDSVREKKNIADKTVAITVDDGYLSTYTTAWPIFKQYGYPFTVFVYVSAVDRRFKNILTWKQIREMRDAGVDFQDHGYRHLRFGDRPSGYDNEVYKVWVKQDLAMSRQRLSEELGQPPQILALPYGEYNAIVLDACRQMGYEAVFSQDPGATSADSDIWHLPREPILGENWSTMPHFIEVLQRVDLPVDDLEPSLVPLDGRVPKRFGARLLYPERYVAGSFGIYVSELGWNKGVEKDGFVSMPNDRPLERRMNRVMISAREKKTDRTAVRFWMVFSE